MSILPKITYSLRYNPGILAFSVSAGTYVRNVDTFLFGRVILPRPAEWRNMKLKAMSDVHLWLPD
jgi:hypothetical protein